MTHNKPILNKRLLWPAAAVALLMLVAETSLAGDASSSASAGSHGYGPGTAAATAGYKGDRGFAKTRTRSGPVNFAQGVSFGIDRHGVSFSTSHAVAGLRGPAVARSMNLSVGFDGRVSRSSGNSIAKASPVRSVHAGGSTRIGHASPAAWATAGGKTGPRGIVEAATRSRIIRHVPYRWR